MRVIFRFLPGDFIAAIDLVVIRRRAAFLNLNVDRSLRLFRVEDIQVIFLNCLIRYIRKAGVAVCTGGVVLLGYITEPQQQTGLYCCIGSALPHNGFRRSCGLNVILLAVDVLIIDSCVFICLHGRSKESLCSRFVQVDTQEQALAVFVVCYCSGQILIGDIGYRKIVRRLCPIVWRMPHRLKSPAERVAVFITLAQTAAVNIVTVSAFNFILCRAQERDGGIAIALDWIRAIICIIS